MKAKHLTLRFITSIASMMAILATIPADAQTVLTDGFETAPGDSGDLNVDNGDFDSVGHTFLSESDRRGVVVYTDTAVNGPVNGLVAEGHQAVRLLRGTSDTTIHWNLPSTWTETVCISFFAHVPLDNTGVRGLEIEIKGTLQGGSTSVIGPHISFNKDTANNWGIGYFVGGVFTRIAPAITDQFIPVQILADATSDRFVVRYGSELYDNNGLGYPFSNALANINVFRIGMKAQGKKSYADSIYVGPPLPPLQTVVIIR